MSRLAIARFAYSNKCENTLQKLILITMAHCPDPSGGDWVVTSISYLSDFCMSPMTEVKKEIIRLCELGALRRIKTPEDADVEPGDICFIGGAQ